MITPAAFLRGAILAGVAATAVAAAPWPVHVAVVSDTHITRDHDDGHELFPGHFREAVAAVNAAHVQFVLITGDLTQGGEPEQFHDFKQIARGFTAPVFWVPGNHDAGNKRLPPRDPGPTAAQMSRCERELGPTYYAHDIDGVHLIGINTQLLGSGLAGEKPEWNFLEQQFAQPVPQPTIVFLHVPPFVNSANEPVGSYWDLDPGPRQRLLGLLQRGGVRLVMTGHLHRPLVNHYGSILFVTSPATSWGIPTGKTAEGWTLLTVQQNGDVQVQFKTIKH